MKVTILVGTMTGTAQLCAQEMELALDDGETEVDTLMMDRLDASVFPAVGVFLICTSTYGQGDVPDNARALYEHLQAAPTCRTCATAYSGLATGPTRKPSTGGKRFDEILSQLGAKRIGERHMHDASSRASCRRRRRVEWCQPARQGPGRADRLVHRHRQQRRDRRLTDKTVSPHGWSISIRPKATSTKSHR